MIAPATEDYCVIHPSTTPQLVVIVDTEEEFPWTEEFTRERTSVTAMRSIESVQCIFDEFGIKPTYVVDYPVASQPHGYEPLQEIYSAGRCLIGAHLHPWVNPPYEEAVTRVHSFPGNLPRELEAKKLRTLTEAIQDRFGSRPVIYKAGRYGIGPNTPAILEELGFAVDCSVCPSLDSSNEGGPDYRDYSSRPYWFGRQRRLLELPLTGGYTGWARRWGSAVHGFATHPGLVQLRAVGLCARLRVVDRVILSPEGHAIEELIRLVTCLYRDGLRIFSFAFHSPSVEPGHTPYVRSHQELKQFLEKCRHFFDFFLGTLGGRPATPLEVRDLLLSPSMES